MGRLNRMGAMVVCAAGLFGGMSGATLAGGAAVVLGVAGQAFAQQGGGAAGKRQREKGTIELVSAGAEPRREARLTATKGQKMRLVAEVGGSMTQKVNGQETPTTSRPGVRTTIDVEVVSVDDKGDISLRATVAECVAMPSAGVAKAAFDEYAKQAEGMKGMELKLTISALGVSGDVETSRPGVSGRDVERIVSGIESVFETPVPRLPDEKIGVGATWRHRWTEKVEQMKIEAVAEYKVERIDESGMAVSAKLTQTGGNQDLELPGRGGTPMRARLESLRGDGVGTMTMVWGMPMVTMMKADVNGKTSLLIKAPQGDVPLDQRVISTLKLEVAKEGKVEQSKDERAK